MDAMAFVNRENIERYRKLASESTDSAERIRIIKLLAEEVSQVQVGTERADGDAPKSAQPLLRQP